MADSSRSAYTKGARGWSTGTKVLLGIVLLVIVIATLAVFTLTIAVLDTTDRDGAAVHYDIPCHPPGRGADHDREQPHPCHIV